MQGRFNIKAILVGSLVQIFSGAVFASVALIVAAARGGGSLPTFGANLQITVTSFYQSPFFIPAMFAITLLSSLLGGYVTGSLAPGAEMKNATGVVTLSLIVPFATRTPVAAPGSVAPPFWYPIATWTLIAPALLAGAALAARRRLAPQLETFDRLQH